MASGESSAVVRHVRVLFDAGAAGGATDGQLLERFRSRAAGGRTDADAAEAAFAVLVARHGPMVLGVCRRALRDPNDVADAFQATFLVLVRKAGSVRVGDSLGRWLYGVSRRVAARARSDAARRAGRDAAGAEPPAPLDDPARAELLAALDEEVARLPEPFRAAVVLCDLAGLPHEAAAGQLGCPVGTVESRLSRGRKRLRDRLTRRGFAPSAALPLAPPALPPALSVSTVQAATASGPVRFAVYSLTQGVLLNMAWTKMKIVGLTLGAAALACGVGAVASHRLGAADNPRRGTAAAPARDDRKAEGLEAPAKVQPGDRLVVEVLEALPGRPITGERLVRPDGTISLGFYGDVKVAGLDRNQIKTRVVEHLRRFLRDPVLGLIEEEQDRETGKTRRKTIEPRDSNRVFVDDTLIYETKQGPARGDEVSRKLDRVLKALESRGPDAPRRPSPAGPAPQDPGRGLPPMPSPGRSPFDIDPRPAAPSVVLPSPSAPAVAPARDDLQVLQNNRWVRVSVNGRPAYVDPASATILTVSTLVIGPADHVVAGAGLLNFMWDQGKEGPFSEERVVLDPTRTPATIDFFPRESAAGSPRVAPGIYKLEGDTLTVCFTPGEGKRPTEFVSHPKQPGCVLDVYRRVRP